jgi:hypothetical protein
VREPEVDQPAQVDCGDPHRESESDLLDAAASDPSVVVRDEPRDEVLEHWSKSTVVLGEVTVPPGAVRLNPLDIVSVRQELAATLGVRLARYLQYCGPEAVVANRSN